MIRPTRTSRVPLARRLALVGFVSSIAACAGVGAGPTAVADRPELASQVEIRRTTYGVPQILAENLRAAAFALAYVQLEDHGARIVEGMQAARGRTALVEGRDRVDADAVARLRHRRAAETFHLLPEDAREVYEGFAAGLNHFIRVNGDEVPAWARPDFTPVDVLARDVTWPAGGAMSSFRRRLLATPEDPRLLVEAGGAWRRAEPGAGRTSSAYRPPERAEDDQNVGSNAWALAPSRSATGNALLLRNPHLSWTAGYYEAHLRVPGELDFYGDFRIGGPFTVIGGFNPHLGFTTTNNESRSHEFYAFRLDPARVDHYLIDGRSRPLVREVVEVQFREAGVEGTEARESWSTEFGPVVHRSDSLVYVYRSANAGNHRAGEQWLEMMKASSLEEWREAMRVGARNTSNFTYADAAGNILYVSVQAAPSLPHPAGGDTLAILATRSEQVWSRLVPFDSLPQVLNPVGGYVHNENDSPHYANLNQVLDHDFPFWVQEPRLRLRSQHAALLLHNDRTFTLEGMVEAKHSMRMLLADRVKDDLVAAVRGSGATGAAARAIDLLESWDNTAAAESRGGVLFEAWWDRYRDLLGDREPYSVPWTPDAPTSTPRGLAEPAAAAAAFGDAVRETAQGFGGWDVAWGEVHRVRRGEVDVPVGGCAGALGCFRVLNFSTAADGKRVADGGDGWVLAVEFGEVPRAYSVLAYGQSPDPESPYHDNQAALFAANRLKPVLWTEAEIEAAVRERYRPGMEPARE